MVFKKIGILVVMFLNLVLVSAAGQSIMSVSYPGDGYKEGTFNFNSVLLRVNTEVNSVCKYSEQNVSYDTMEGSFDPSLGKVHEKSFTKLKDGAIYTYYVKCVEDPDNYTEPPALKVVFKIDSLVSADIFLDKEEPLRAGKVKVHLVVSKPIIKKPSLSYSFDGIVYKKVFLTGSGQEWDGYIIIPEDLKESILSFKFSAVDLEGRVGEEINTGESFLIDTSKPGVIADLSAVGYVGEIRLSWYFDEEVEKFKIYRSESPNVDYTHFYTTTEESPFYDRGVEKGKTYYYRISAVDEAGNEGELSREVYATALVDNTSISTGLSVQLRGFVDNFLSEIDSVLSEISVVENSISGKKKDFFSYLGLDREIENKKHELESLKRDVEKFKLQDLTKDELDKKISSSRLKLNIIRKEIPEDLVVLKEGSDSVEMSEEKIEESILEIKPEISEKEKDKSVKESMKIIKDSGLVVNNYYAVIEIVYLDGSRKSFSLVKRDINAELEKDRGVFVEIIPKEVVESASELSFKNANYKIIKNDPVLSFGSDTKQIIYFFEKEAEISSLKDIGFAFVHIWEEEEQSPGITGYFLLSADKIKYPGIGVGLVVILGLIVYFVYLKKKGSESSLRIFGKVEKALELLDKKDIKKAREIYVSITEDYKNLNNKDKKKVHDKVKFLHDSILASILKNKLEELKISKDKELLKKLEKIYEGLSDDFKKKMSEFEKIKEEVEDEK